jgi:hypothetical protein
MQVSPPFRVIESASLARAQAILPAPASYAAVAGVADEGSLIASVRGAAPFVAQQIVQETLGDGLDAPRWRDRAAVYAPRQDAAPAQLVTEA